MIRTRGLTHIHLVVRDLDRSLRFYKRVFGLEERFCEGLHMVFLNTPATHDLITLNANRDEAQLAGVNGGVNHFGFPLTEISDLDTAIKERHAARGPLIQRGEHAPGAPCADARHPARYLLA